MSSYKTRYRKFKKEKKKHYYGSFQAKIRWERLRKRENKKNRSDEFLLDP